MAAPPASTEKQVRHRTPNMEACILEANTVWATMCKVDPLLNTFQCGLLDKVVHQGCHFPLQHNGSKFVLNDKAVIDLIVAGGLSAEEIQEEQQKQTEYFSTLNLTCKSNLPASPLAMVEKYMECIYEELPDHTVNLLHARGLPKDVEQLKANEACYTPEVSH